MRPLTHHQKRLLGELLSEPVGVTMECHPEERRTAEALSRRGLIKILPGESPAGHFEIVATCHQ